MALKDHIHTYTKWQVLLPGGKREHKLCFGEKGYKCKDPDCNHTAPYSLVLGKRSLCTRCGKPFVLDRKSMMRTEPRCIECSNTVEGRAYRAGKEAIKELVTDLPDFTVNEKELEL